MVGEPSTRCCCLANHCTRHRWLLNPGEKKGGKRLPLHSLQAWISRALIKGEAPAIIILPRNFSHWSGEFPTEPNFVGLFTAIIIYLCPVSHFVSSMGCEEYYKLGGVTITSMVGDGDGREICGSTFPFRLMSLFLVNKLHSSSFGSQGVKGW